MTGIAAVVSKRERVNPRRRSRPLVSADAVRAWADREGIELAPGDLSAEVVDAYLSRRAQASRVAPSRRRGRPRILVVDDERDMRVWLRSELELMGWEVSEANDALTGIERYHDAAPDVVVVDEHMPGVRGLDMARRIRDHNDGVTILLFSASVASDVVAEAERLSVHFVSKVNHDGLLKHLKILHTHVHG